MTKAELAIQKVSELNKLVLALNKFGRQAGLHNRRRDIYGEHREGPDGECQERREAISIWIPT